MPIGCQYTAMASDDNPELTAEEIEFIRRLKSQAPSRRDVLKGAAVGALGMGLGSAATSSVAADASTSDSDGDVGQPGDRVDLFADGADANSVDTDEGHINPGYTSDITLNVPSDYNTLQSAVNAAVHRWPEADGGNRVIVNIESGHNIQTGPTRSDPAGEEGDEPVAVWVENVDASHVWIQSADATVGVESGFDGSIVRGVRSYLPVLDCKIDVANTGSGNVGYAAEMGSVGFVEPGAGVINAPNKGLRARQVSTIYASFGVDFSGAGGYGCHLNHGSTAYVRDGDFSGSGTGLRMNQANGVEAQDAIFSGATNEGAYVSNSGWATLLRADLSNAGGDALKAERAITVDARAADMTGAGSYSVNVASGALVNIQTASVGGTSGDRDHQSGGIIIDGGGVKFASADVTGDTFVRFERASDSTGVSGYVNAFDSTTNDNNGEANSSQQFTPATTGWYQILAKARWDSANDGDRLDIRLRNVDAGDTVEFNQEETGGTDWDYVELNEIVELTGGSTYEIQTQNADSQDTLSSASTVGVISKQLVHD